MTGFTGFCNGRKPVFPLLCLPLKHEEFCAVDIVDVVFVWP